MSRNRDQQQKLDVGGQRIANQRSLKQQKLDVGGQRIAKQRSLKQQIRDIRRLLAKDDIPETVRLTKERILKSLQGEIDDKVAKKQKQKVIKKYRMVKFFEKRKVIRRINKAGKEYSEDGLEEDERAKLLSEINRLRQELNYIVHFPPDEKYIALYPSSKTGSESALAKQEELLQSITESVESGELPDAALEGKGVCLPSGLISQNKDTDLEMFRHGAVCSLLTGPRLPSSAHQVENEPERTDIESRISESVGSPDLASDLLKMSSGSTVEGAICNAGDSRTVVKNKRSARQQGKKKLRKRKPIDEGRESDTDVHASARKKLKEDTFFLADSDS